MTRKQVEELFSNLENGHGERFFEKVAENVSWTVMGTHPLAGAYKSKKGFLDATFRRLERILKEGVVLKVLNVFVEGDSAVVEMRSLSTARNGKPFDNSYCWVVRFENGIIVEVRAYVDSALVQRLVDENETNG